MPESREASTAASETSIASARRPAELERVALDEHHRDEQPPLAGRPRDRDAAVDVGDGLVPVLEVVLGPAEVVQRLEARRQLGIRELIDLGERLGAVLARRR